MVSHYAENPLIIVSGLLREELYDDTSLWMRFDDTLGFTEGVYVCLISIELERSGLTAIITNVQKSVGRTLNLNFTKVNGFGWKAHIHAQGFSGYYEFEYVSSENIDVILGARICSGLRWLIDNSYFSGWSWLNSPSTLT